MGTIYKKVKARANFAAFRVALNEPFYFLNGAVYLLQWKDAEAARAFCADNEVRPRDLAKMEFSEVELNNYDGHWLEEDPRAKFRRELDELGSEADLEPFEIDKSPLEIEALEAYRRDLNEYGRLDMSREAYIANYIETHKNK